MQTGSPGRSNQQISLTVTVIIPWIGVDKTRPAEPSADLEHFAIHQRIRRGCLAVPKNANICFRGYAFGGYVIASLRAEIRSMQETVFTNLSDDRKEFMSGV